MPIYLSDLIPRLATRDPSELRRVSAEILSVGARAVPELTAALRSEEPDARKAAAYLLGALRAVGSVDALRAALADDPEAKVRQNAAVALGKIGRKSAVGALAGALGAEVASYARRSILLALGAIAGDAARAVLQGYEPVDAAESEARRKALDRCSKTPPRVRWNREGRWTPPVLLRTAPGLEEIAAEEAAEKTGGGWTVESPGLLRNAAGVPPWNLIPNLRCASIGAVIGAALARLVRTGGSRVVFDPTCGSGTLLIERAMLDDRVKAFGIDISRTAVNAAAANVKAAGLAPRVRTGKGDANRIESWPRCDEVVANLPFGFRTGSRVDDLEGLYRNVLTGIAERLREDGKALLYTANQKTLSRAHAPLAKRLAIETSLRVHAGGLWCYVWMIRLRS